MRRPKNAGWFSLAIALVMASAATSRADDEAACLERVKKEYPAAFRKLSEQYAQVRGSGMETTEFTGRAGITRTRTRVAFTMDGPFQKVALSGLEGRTEGRSWTACVTPEDSFLIETVKAGHGPVFTDLGKPVKRNSATMQVNMFQQDFLRTLSTTPSTPRGLFADPAVTLKGATPVQRDGNSLVRIVYIQEHGAVKQLEENTLLVAPDRGWLVVEHEGSAGRMVRIEYKAKADGPAVPKKITIVAGPTTRTFEFEDFRFGPSPKDEFTPRGCGFDPHPDPE